MTSIARLGFSALFATASFAATITMTHTGTGSGQIGATPFTNAAFTFTDIGDTTNRVSFSGGYAIPNTSVSIQIGGVGTFNITTPTRMFVNNSVNVVGFSRLSGSDLFDGPTNSAFNTWAMLTGIGPISGTGSLVQWSLSPVNTSGGDLNFNGGSTATVFTAAIGGDTVPEPSTYLSLGIGLIGIAAAARRRNF